jgi:DNA-binding LytR/AlgR family response regulator
MSGTNPSIRGTNSMASDRLARDIALRYSRVSTRLLDRRRARSLRETRHVKDSDVRGGVVEDAPDYFVTALNADRFAKVGGCTRYIVGERQHRLYPLDPVRIDYIESDANYVTIRIGNCEYISRDTIKRLSVALADLGFVRIERSLLLNIRAVAYVENAGYGSYAFTLGSGACLHSTATYREEILRVLPLSQRS